MKIRYFLLTIFVCACTNTHNSKPPKLTFSPEEIQRMENDCNNKSLAVACSGVFLAYEQGESVPQDKFKAKEYLEKACRFGSEIACKNLRHKQQRENNMFYQMFQQ